MKRKNGLIILLLGSALSTGCMSSGESKESNRPMETRSVGKTTFPAPSIPFDITVIQKDDMYTIGDVNREGVVVMSGKKLKAEFEKFEKSDNYPKFATRDLRTTPWGYRGSGSVLKTFYQYIYETYPKVATK